MKKMQYLRTWLVIALVVTIIGSVTGGTLAWFTDTVTSEKNVIQAGNLKLSVEYYDAEAEEWYEVKEDTKLFNENALYEPGYTELVFLRIKNAGNLALKYKVALSVVDTVIGESVLGNKIYLSEYMQVGTLVQNEISSSLGDLNMFEYMLAAYKNRSQALAAVSAVNGSSTGLLNLRDKDDANLLHLAAVESQLLPGDENALIMPVVLHMPTYVDNQANHVPGTAAPQMEIGLHIVATQYTEEMDSFDNQYDVNATYPLIEVVDPNMPKAAVSELEGTELEVDCVDELMGVSIENVIGFPVLKGGYELDFGLKFATTESIDDLDGVDYRNWTVDFELASTKPLYADDTESRITLAGFYPFAELAETGDWIAFKITGVDVPANEFQRIVGIYDANITYKQVVEAVGEFKCGVIVDTDYFAGETLTLKLCMYEPDGTRHVIKTFEKTF